MGFTKPSPIQEKAIGPLMMGKDVIGQAKTGSGKTAAFSLPLLQSIDRRNPRVQALVMAPTRELAVQITEEMRKLAVHTGVRIVTIYGGQPIGMQRDQLRRGAQVVVGTTGRLTDHINRRWLDLGAVKFVVLDEADTMLDMGFIDDVDFILSHIPGKRQLCIFSATMPHKITELSRKYMTNPEKFLINSDEPSVETLDQYYAVVKHDEKLTFLIDLLKKERPASTIIFRRTKRGADKLAMDLHRGGYEVVPLHGNLSQNQRDRYMEAFRKGRADILVATDIASRGIDVSQVACVVNFDVPVDPLIYFHRVGRTARAGRQGKAYSFVSREESGDFARILRMTKAPIQPMRPEDKLHTFDPNQASSFRSGGQGRPNNRGQHRPNASGRPTWKRYHSGPARR
ncbi:MAG: DEAD/DEAH box helicase [Thaumarchaeota archaeon]|nr:DEAD/DEAH box helicase [Nitrososphaerota archaeon]